MTDWQGRGDTRHLNDGTDRFVLVRDRLLWKLYHNGSFIGRFTRSGGEGIVAKIIVDKRAEVYE